MASQPRTLRVYPNPYLHIDADGRPVAALPIEPAHNNDTGHRRVGMVLKHALISKADRLSPQQDMQETWFEPADELPVTVPETAYYQAAIRDGSVIPADEATSRASSKPHVDPAIALAKQRDLAVERLKDQAHEHHDDRMVAALKAHAFGPMTSSKPAAASPSLAPKKGAE